MLEKESEEKIELIETQNLDEIEEVKNQDNIETQNVEIIEEKKDNNLTKPNNNENINYLENIKLLPERERELRKKKDLVKVFENLAKNLDTGNNILKNINEVYEIYLENELIKQNHIKSEIGESLLKFMFFFIAPLYGIIFLIGIFQIKSLMGALFDLIKRSTISYYDCNIKSNCNITISNNENHEFDFYNYYYYSSMNETIDLNLMMITGFIGTILLKWKGFKITTFILCLFNFGSIFWLLNFDFHFSNEGIFDYDLLKIINLGFIYLLLLCGLGGSSLLSNQILVESYLKYKDFIIQRLIQKTKNHLRRQSTSIDSIKNDLNLEKPQISKTITFTYSKKQTESLDEIDKQNQKKLKDLFDKRKKQNKFDFFFMICLTTMIGYLGKYSMNLFLDYFLIIIYGDNYDKRLFLYYIAGLYGISLCFSILLYIMFKGCIFEDDTKKENKEKKEKKKN